MTAVPKLIIVRDRKWLDDLKVNPCWFTGFVANEYEAVDPAHVGTLGKGMKSGDDEAFGLRHSLHVDGHNDGEISMIRKWIPDWMLREAFRLFIRKQYEEWKQSQSDAPARRIP